MVKRCEHCKFYEDVVFIQETESGYGLWQGYCKLKHIDVKNLWFACEDFQPKNKSRRVPAHDRRSKDEI